MAKKTFVRGEGEGDWIIFVIVTKLNEKISRETEHHNFHKTSQNAKYFLSSVTTGGAGSTSVYIFLKEKDVF